MKRIKRLLSICCIFAIMLCITPLSAHAATTMPAKSETNSSKFDNEWEKTTTYKIDSTKIGYMIQGFDKDYINEDYVWSVGNECSSQPSLYRDGYDTSYVTGTWGQTYLYGKIEVQHKTYLVKYRMTFSATYDESAISSTTTNSSVKL